MTGHEKNESDWNKIKCWSAEKGQQRKVTEVTELNENEENQIYCHTIKHNSYIDNMLECKMLDKEGRSRRDLEEVSGRYLQENGM